MKTRAAILREQPGTWDVVEADLDEPKEFEILVRNVAAGLCHSDDHLTKADVPSAHLPYCGGHEGAGIVEKVGSSVREVKPGDHIITSFIPGCGRCRWCASGQQNLCDNGALMMMGCQLDGTFRMHVDGQDVAQASFTGTFSEYSVMPEWAAVKIDPDIPLGTAALVGCAVPTGWGSAVNGAQVKPGDIVIVMGTGGIGINAVQGAVHAGAERVIAVDPVALKREKALQVGATDAVETIEEAGELARSISNGRGADSAIVTVGVVKGEHLGQAFSTIGKAGTMVLTGVANVAEVGIPVNLFETAMFQKRIQGALFGMMSPTKDIPRLLSLYQRGMLKLDELVTTRYTLDEINTGYEDLHAGRNVRGVIDF